MINQKAEIESQPLIENIGKFESKKKLKKVRSMKKLQRLSSRGRGRKPQYDLHSLSTISSVDSETSQHQTPIEVTDSSPNYMKATSSSHAKDSFQVVFADSEN